MKYGDPFEQALFLESDAGVAASYANAAAFTAAGWALSWEGMDGVAIASQPGYTIAVDGASGRHKLLFTLPSVPSNLKITWPSGFRSDPAEIPLIFATADEDTVVNLITAAIGAPVAQDRVTQYDWETTENDSFAKEMTIPAAAITDWGYTDLTAAGWTVTAAARADGDTGTAAPLFVMTAAITDTALRKIRVSYNPFPTAAALTATELASGSKRVNYDAQLSIPVSWTLASATAGVNGTLTIAGDQRKYFSANTGATFAISGGANAGTYTPTAIAYTGGNTVITAANVPSAVVTSSTVVATLKITGIRGAITIKRQEDRT